MAIEEKTTWDICVYVDENGSVPMYVWTKTLQVIQRSKLDSQIDRLHLNGESLRGHDSDSCALTGTTEPGISKLRVKGNVQLRPMLYKKNGENFKSDPNDYCYVFLTGAIEKGGKLIPGNAALEASGFKAKIEKNISRKEHHVNYPKKTT